MKEKESIFKEIFAPDIAFLQSLRESKELVIFFLISLVLLGGFFGFLIYMASKAN